MKNYNNSASCCILEKDSSFKGEFKSECDFRVDGYFEGSIETNGKVVIGKNGRIEGTVVCSSADIEDGYILSCQARPTSDEVEVNYDEV